jgi:hypothetical protein
MVSKSVLVSGYLPAKPWKARGQGFGHSFKRDVVEQLLIKPDLVEVLVVYWIS